MLEVVAPMDTPQSIQRKLAESGIIISLNHVQYVFNEWKQVNKIVDKNLVEHEGIHSLNWSTIAPDEKDFIDESIYKGSGHGHITR